MRRRAVDYVDETSSPRCDLMFVFHSVWEWRPWVFFGILLCLTFDCRICTVCHGNNSCIQSAYENCYLVVLVRLYCCGCVLCTNVWRRLLVDSEDFGDCGECDESDNFGDSGDGAESRGFCVSASTGVLWRSTTRLAIGVSTCMVLSVFLYLCHLLSHIVVRL